MAHVPCGRAAMASQGLDPQGQTHGGGPHPLPRAGETEAHTATHPRQGVQKLVWASPSQGFSSSFLVGGKRTYLNFFNTQNMFALALG